MKKCIYCHKEIIGSNKNVSIYCSRKCYGSHYKEQKVRKTGTVKKCLMCHNDFYVIPSRKNANFCSAGCKKEYHRTAKTCLMCHKDFYVDRCRTLAKFCSLKCKMKYVELHGNPLKNRKKVKCKQCGKEFEKINYQKTVFCSRLCFSKFRKGNKDYAVGHNKGKHVGCLYCGKLMWVFRFRAKTCKFCSTECYNNYRRDFLICPTCKKPFSAQKYENRKYCSEVCAAKGVAKRKSHFHLSVVKFLRERFFEYPFEEEKCVFREGHKYFIDAVLCDKIAVEFDGTWWHCDPRVYSADYLHPKLKRFAKEIWQDDERKTNDLALLGYNVLRFCEKDWNENRQEFFVAFEEKIKCALQELKT